MAADLDDMCICGHPRRSHNEFVNPGCYFPACLCKKFQPVKKMKENEQKLKRDKNIPTILGQLVIELLKIDRIDVVEIRKDRIDSGYQILVQYDNPVKFCAMLFADIEIETMNEFVSNIVDRFERNILEHDVQENIDGQE